MNSSRGAIGASTSHILGSFRSDTPEPFEVTPNIVALIQGHEEIEAFLNDVSGDETLLNLAKDLLGAIHRGDYAADIFSQPGCYLYLLYILREEWLPFEYGMTVYLYIMGLQQFTTRQTLHEADQNYKTLREFSVMKLTAGASITDESRLYLVQVARDLQQYIGKNCFSELNEYVRDLPASEKWVLEIPCDDDIDPSLPWHVLQQQAAIKGFDLLIKSLAPEGVRHQAIPYFQFRGNPSGEGRVLFFPSQSIIRFCLSKISENPLTPIFRLSPADADVAFHDKWHHQQQILLYSPHVDGREVEAYHYQCGGMGVAFNHLTHIFWGSLLSRSFRNTINKFLIPNFEKLKFKAIQFEDRELTILISRVVSALNKFDLSAIPPGNIAAYPPLYLGHIFNQPEFIKLSSQNKMGSRIYDSLLFLMYQHQALSKNWNEKEIEMWTQTIFVVSKHTDYNRGGNLKDAAMSDMLKTLATGTLYESPIGCYVSHKIKLDCEAWLEMLYTIDDSEALWHKAILHHYDELLSLITHAHLKFYHPYLPMTDTTRQDLIAYVRSHWLNKTNVASERVLNEASGYRFSPH